MRAVRAFHPRPGAWIVLDGDPVKILAADIGPGAVVERGRVESVSGQPCFGLADGVLFLTLVQPAGKNPLLGIDWLNGRRGRGGVVEPVVG
jgi:methionyl-tRNA formyltransferase